MGKEVMTLKPLMFSADNPTALLCPRCFQWGGMESGDRPSCIGEDRDEYDSPIGTRGGWTAFDGQCSACGCEWKLYVANHKGMLFLGVVDTGNP
jgi:hypothetical protein